MKSEEQVQRAHDMLGGVLLGDVPNPLKPEDQPLLVAAMDVLCWVLDHAHNDNFASNLRKLEAELRAIGYDMTRLPGPPAPGKIQ